MTKYISDPIETQDRPVTYQLPDPSLKVTHFHCSTFIQGKKLLIKGECDKPSFQERNALLVFFDVFHWKSRVIRTFPVLTVRHGSQLP